MIKKIENVQIDITTLCNFQCRHCSVAWHKCNEEMNLDQIRDIANQLEKYDVEMIAISGGEPSLHKNFIDVVKLLAQKFMVKINTNAYNLDLWLKELDGLQNRVMLQISIDGYDASTFKFIRQNDSYSKIIENVQYCRKMQFSVVIKTILSAKTKNHIEDLKKMADSLDCQLAIGFLAKQGRSCENNEIALTGEEIIEQYKKHTENYSDILQKGLFSNQLCPLLLDPDRISVLRIMTDGTTYPCTAMDHKNLSIGNINSMMISEMLDSFWIFQKKLLDELYSKKCLECGIRKGSPRPGCFCECAYFSDGTCDSYR